jgi:hypothetical protein
MEIGNVAKAHEEWEKTRKDQAAADDGEAAKEPESFHDYFEHEIQT